MSRRRAILTLGLCFGIGLGLAPTLPQAQACSCLSEPFWKLSLASIEGDGDRSVEETYWESAMWLDAEGRDARTQFDTHSGVALRRTP
ncbi:MAG: hypothetical protein R3B09_21070 [Nannocystaceae bacterium]